MNSRPRRQLTGLLLTFASILITLTALCFGGAARAAAPEPGPTPVLRGNGRIAFMHLQSFYEGENIYVVNPDGTYRTLLFDAPNHQKDPAWSADGKYIAYSSAQRGLWEIYRADADGSNQVALSDGIAAGAVDDWPSWSPDGQTIVFVRNRQLWTIGRDGGTAVKLSTGSDQDEQPAWSPDGTKIAFVRNASSATAQVWVMDADGSNQRNLSNNEWLFNRYPAWSPDGSRIVFQRWNDLWVMDADGSNQTQITFAASGGYVKPSWSPDGTQIVATNDINFDGDIFVMNADGSDIRKIADGVHPTWQPLPALGLTAVHAPNPVVPGAELTYTLSVTNNHPLTATGATLTDTLDPGTTFVSAEPTRGSCATPAAGATGTVTCSFGNLVKGEQAAVTVVVQVSAAADGATLHNVATGAATYAGYGQQADSADISTQVINPNADLSLDARINEGLYVPAGGQFVYSVYVYNAGHAQATDVTLTGQLPAGVTLDNINNDGGSCASAGGGNFTCTFPSLDLYESHAVLLTATNGAAGAPNTQLTATFTIAAAAPGDNNPFNNTAAVDFFIAAPPLPTPTPGPSNDGLLAYSKQLLSTGRQDVFRQRADGDGIVNLTDDDPAQEGFFVWSPDGSRLAFLRYDFGNQTVSLGTVAADGSGRTLLASVPGEYIDSCSWSPDGTRLAFTARASVFDINGGSDVFVINADGTGRTNLTNGDGFNGDASWSPDGTRVVYTRTTYGAGAV
ncbi:MAG TPA: DPP IV N-terminal domain-containing protein, partial [Pyrinomonadaceae bacterium]